MLREKRLASPARVQKSYRCSAPMSGPGSLRRGIRFTMSGMNSTVWKAKMCDIWVASGRACLGAVGYRLLISCTMSRVTGTGGALRAAARSGKRGDFVNPGFRLFRSGSWASLDSGGNVAFGPKTSPRHRRGPDASPRSWHNWHQMRSRPVCPEEAS